MFKKFFFILSVLAMGISAEEAEKHNLAVLDLGASTGVTDANARMIADRLETELISRGAFVVLERRRMDDILKEQGFQQTGACDASSCEVQVGQLLGVDRIVTGSLGKIGGVYSLNVKLLDVGSGKILQSHAVDVRGDLSLALTQGCGQIAEKLSTQEQASSAESLGGGNIWWIAGGAALLTAAGVGTYILLNDDAEPSVMTVDRTLQTGN